MSLTATLPGIAGGFPLGLSRISRGQVDSPKPRIESANTSNPREAM